MLPLLLLSTTLSAHAGTDDGALERIAKVWSAEISFGVNAQGDLTGNVRDVPRAYSAGQVVNNIPLGPRFSFRNILRYPAGLYTPALLLDISYAGARSAGEFEDYGAYDRRASYVALRAGAGLCMEGDNTCIFAAYGFRQINTRDDGLPIDNLAAVLGSPSEGEEWIPSFVERYLGAILPSALVDGLLSTLDFDSQRVRVDLTDRVRLQGGSLSIVTGIHRRITLDTNLAYFLATQTHTTAANIVANVNNTDASPTIFDYEWEKTYGALAVDVNLSVGLLPERFKPQLSVGLNANLLTLNDTEPDRQLGTWLQMGGFLGAKW